MVNSVTNKGKFIVFEGGEGSGKSTQLTLLAKYLESKGVDVYKTKEPGGTGLGQQIRKYLLGTDTKIEPMTELMLYMADRSEHIAVIKEQLKSGIWVLCDRFSWSTLAYQGYGCGHSLELINILNEAACQGLKPDWTILLDIDPKIGLSRKFQQCEINKFELENIEFHNRVRKGYQQIFLPTIGNTEFDANMYYCQSNNIETLHNLIINSLPFDIK